MIPKNLRSRIKTGGAMYQMSSHYPERYNGKIPLRIKMLKNVKSDLPFLDKNFPVAKKGDEYYVSVNCHGAVTLLFDDGNDLGVKPDEFEVVEYHEINQ